jgi:hypothetical protein
MDIKGKEKLLWIIVILCMAVIAGGWIFSFSLIKTDDTVNGAGLFAQIKEKVAPEIPKFKQMISAIKEKTSALNLTDENAQAQPALTQEQIEYMKNKIQASNSN